MGNVRGGSLNVYCYFYEDFGVLFFLFGSRKEGFSISGDREGVCFVVSLEKFSWSFWKKLRCLFVLFRKFTCFGRYFKFFISFFLGGGS